MSAHFVGWDEHSESQHYWCETVITLGFASSSQPTILLPVAELLT